MTKQTQMTKQAQMMEHVLKRMNLKETVDFIHPKRAKERKLPTVSSKNYVTKNYDVEGFKYATIAPIQNHTQYHIVFFHGGGYSHEGSPRHFHWIKKYLDNGKFTVSFINYPLAPEYTAEKTIDIAIKCYEHISKDHVGQEFVLMGDSAGGGLALAISMELRNRGLVMPIKTVLFSPWLDIDLKNPLIENYQSIDYVLSVTKLREIGTIYRQGYDPTDFHVSPLYGDFDHLGELAIFYGTKEIFCPDCSMICNKTNLTGTQFTRYEYEDMQHDWVLLPLPEAEKAIHESIDYILT